MLYAVDANEVKVGAWELRETLPVKFWTPDDTPGCDEKVVMHADAQPKHYAHSLTFRAPAAGMGPLTFRALLKQGDTNGGAFYWPVAPAMGSTAAPENGVAGGDLVLSERGGAPPKQAWFRATGPGQSCVAVCAANGGTCDVAALEATVSNPGSVKASNAPYVATIDPPIAGCAAALPAVAEGYSENWLFFHTDEVRVVFSRLRAAARALTRSPDRPSHLHPAATHPNRLCTCAGPRKHVQRERDQRA